mgnify:CR=1 FL=1
MTIKVVSNGDAGTTDLVGGDDWDSLANAINLKEDYDYLIRKSGSTYYAKTSAGEIGFSGVDVGVVFNSCIDALTTGGEIAFAGTLTITSTTIVPKNLITIKGFGDSSILQLGSSANRDVMKSYNFDTLTGTNSTGGVHGVVLKDFVIDGDYANNTSGYGIKCYGYNWKIENVTVRNCENDGIYSEWSTSTSPPSPDSMETTWVNVKVHHCQDVNIRYRGSHDSHWYRVIAYAGQDGNVVVESSANYDGGVEMTACHFWGAVTTTPSLLITSAAVIANNIISEGSSGSGGVGIKVQSGGTLRGRVTTFANETGILLNSNNNQLDVYSYNNTNGIVINSSNNMLRGKIETNTTYGLWITDDFGALSNFTIDVRMKGNATHIFWETTHSQSLVRAHIITAATETAVSGTISLTTNIVAIYSVGGGTNYTSAIPVNTAGTLNETGLSRVVRTPVVLTAPSFRKRGFWQGGNSAGSGDGVFSQNVATIAVGTGANTKTIDTTNGYYLLSGSGATTGGIGGVRFSTYTCRGLNPYLKIYAKLVQTAGNRVTLGLIGLTTAPTAGADPLANLSGAVFFFDDAVNANWRFYTNNGGASSTNTDTTVAAGTSLVTFEIQADETNTRFQWALSAGGGGSYTNISTTVPATSTALGAFAYIESTTSGAKNINLLYIETEVDK